MDPKVVNFFQPGKILSIRFVGGVCVVHVDFGAEVAVILQEYHDEQVGDYIMMDGGVFVKVFQRNVVSP